MANGRGKGKLGRRRVLKTIALGAVLGAAGLTAAYRPLRKWWRLDCQSVPAPEGVGYGPLVPDPKGLLDLPRGFSYRVLCRKGEIMDDGFRVPGAADGAGVFAMPDGSYRIIRNCEISATRPQDGPYGEEGKPPDAHTYDPNCRGGTITLELDRDLNLRRKWLSLAGTERNCAGGVTPWGTWLSCEESLATPASNGIFTRPHGFVFEVPAAQDELAPPRLLKAMGRFNHEGAAVNLDTGEIYQTEDMGDGCLYKFAPHRRGDLSRGRLFALSIKGHAAWNTGNREGGGGAPFPVGEPLAAEWVELADPDPRDEPLRVIARNLGAATFHRGEGIAWGPQGAVFSATSAGPQGLGQLWRYTPRGKGGGMLTLLEQPDDKCRFYMPDNVAVQPNGDIILAEDNRRYTRLVCITPDGRWYPLAYYRYDTLEEFAGMAFSPDARFMTVSVYERGMTVLVTGPFRQA